MRLIDADAFREDYALAERCEDCQRYSKKDCDYPYYSARDFCGWLDDAPTVGGWVSVQDRLPGSSGIKVIVSAKTVPESVMKTKAVFVAFLGYGDGKWYTPDVDFMVNAKTGNDNVHPVWEITHWMFLPEPPKEDKDGE